MTYKAFKAGMAASEKETMEEIGAVPVDYQ